MKLKRILALALALVLVMSLFPAQALATEPTEDPTTPATTAPTEEPTVPTETATEAATEAPVPQTTEEAVPQTTEEPAPSEGGLLDGIADFLTGGDKKEENPDVTTGETTSPTELDDTLNIEIDPIPQELNTAQLYEAMFQQKTIRDLFNVINENVDALVGVTDEEGNYLPDMPGFTIGQVYEMDDLLQELKTTSIMDQDELEALEQMNDNVATMIEMLGYETCICRGITEHSHNCPMHEAPPPTKRPIRHVAYEAPVAPLNSGVHSSKDLVTDDKGNLAIQLEAWTEGSTAVVPTEIVFVVDQSGSMMQAADGKNSFQKYSAFIKNQNLNFDRARAHPGYYAAITNRPSNYTSDWNGNGTDGYLTYIAALLKYEDDEWKRTNAVGQERQQWDNLTINPTFQDFYKIGYHTLTSQNFNNNSTAKYFKTLYGATLDGYYALLEEVKTIQNVKIAVVGFSTPRGCGNSGILGGTGIFKDGVFTHANDLTESDYRNAWHTTDSQANLNKASSSVGAILPRYGSTCTEDGFLIANEIFKYGDPNANRMVVLFTDGAPYGISTDTDWVNRGNTDNTAYDKAIEAAYKTKNEYNASVYVYGPSNLKQEDARMDPFMDRLSSNYKDATTLKNGTAVSGADYYGMIGSSADLENTFKEIGKEIFNASQALDKDAAVVDTITQYFNVGGDYTTEGKKGITLWEIQNKLFPDGTVDFDEANMKPAPEGTGYTLTENVEYTNSDIGEKRTGTKIEITGFDFMEKCVDMIKGTGSKLRVMIPIIPKPEFIGGNDVLTNSEDGGVFDKDNQQFGEFVPEDTEISFAPEIKVDDAYNYYGSAFLQELDLTHLKDIISVSVNNQNLDLTKPEDNYGLEDWQVDYVTIDVQLYMDKNGDGQYSEDEKVDKLECRGDDIEFAVELTISPKNDGSEDAVSAIATGTLKLFYPTLTFHDGLFFYGESIPTGNTAVDLNHGPYWDLETPIVWTAGDGKQPDDENILILGGEPELYMTYTPRKTGTFGKQDVPVDVNIYADPDKALDITEHCTLAHKPCDDVNWPDCTPISTHSGNSDGYEFWFHVKTCELTITKSSGDSLEPYVFDVYRNGQYYTQVSVLGDNSTTIYELPIGTYTIQENEAWSWRYTPSYTNNEVFLGRDGDRIGFEADEIICTNGLDTHQWLNGYSTVVKNVFGEKH